MALKKVYTVTDLGPGDGGKGGVVHKLCALRQPHTVIKVGGAQGSHGVYTANGDQFNFSQFGCGTFNGARTHISDRFVIDPDGLLNEGEALRYECGVRDVYSLLTVDENALCVTPFHGIASRLRELARRNNPRGTVGVGVGEAFLDAQSHPELAIRAKDLNRSDLLEILEEVQIQKLRDLGEIVDSYFLGKDAAEAIEHIALLHDQGLAAWTADRYRQMAQAVKIVDADYLRREIFARDGVMVVESSHGILTDRYHGFHPHTSKLRTLPNLTTWDLFDQYGYDGQVVKLAVTRAYQIRHGAGPMVTEDVSMGEALLPGSNKDENRYQGKVRVGSLDCVALRYALGVCGGRDVFDGLAVTWFDQIEKNGEWSLCESYSGAYDPRFFLSPSEIAIRHGSDDAQLMHQEQLGKQLRMCRPELTRYPIGSQDRTKTIACCADALKESLGVPVRMISFGKTENDKVCF